MTKSFLFLLLTIGVMSCRDKEDIIRYEEKSFTIQYDLFNIEKLDSLMWIKIDNTIYTHTNNLTLQPMASNVLPSFKSITSNYNGKELEEKANPISLGISFYSILESKHKYQFINLKSLYTNGIINLKRKDSKSIFIEYPKGYPIKIKVKK